MLLNIYPSALRAAELLAREIIQFVQQTSEPVLGLATGATMEPVYEQMVDAHRRGDVSFRTVTSFNLDEYIGLPAKHPGSYRSTMDRLLFDHIDIDKARTFLPNGCAEDLDLECARYEAAMREAGGIGLQILGIGQNGHIAFNEPGSSFASRTRQVSLHPSTLCANQSFFTDRPVPDTAITMGIGTILDARHIRVLATGTTKSVALRAAIEGKADEACPASALQDHADVIWHADKAAAAPLEEEHVCRAAE